MSKYRFKKPRIKYYLCEEENDYFYDYSCMPKDYYYYWVVKGNYKYKEFLKEKNLAKIKLGVRQKELKKIREESLRDEAIDNGYREDKND